MPPPKGTSLRKLRRLSRVTYRSLKDVHRRCWKRYETTLQRHSGQRTLNVDELKVADYCTEIDKKTSESEEVRRTVFVYRPTLHLFS